MSTPDFDQLIFINDALYDAHNLEKNEIAFKKNEILFASNHNKKYYFNKAKLLYNINDGFSTFVYDANKLLEVNNVIELFSKSIELNYNRIDCKYYLSQIYQYVYSHSKKIETLLELVVEYELNIQKDIIFSTIEIDLAYKDLIEELAIIGDGFSLVKYCFSYFEYSKERTYEDIIIEYIPYGYILLGEYKKASKHYIEQKDAMKAAGNNLLGMFLFDSLICEALQKKKQFNPAKTILLRYDEKYLIEYNNKAALMLVEIYFEEKNYYASLKYIYLLEKSRIANIARIYELRIYFLLLENDIIFYPKLLEKCFYKIINITGSQPILYELSLYIEIADICFFNNSYYDFAILFYTLAIRQFGRDYYKIGGDIDLKLGISFKNWERETLKINNITNDVLKTELLNIISATTFEKRLELSKKHLLKSFSCLKNYILGTDFYNKPNYILCYFVDDNEYTLDLLASERIYFANPLSFRMHNDESDCSIITHGCQEYDFSDFSQKSIRVRCLCDCVQENEKGIELVGDMWKAYTNDKGIAYKLNISRDWLIENEIYAMPIKYVEKKGIFANRIEDPKQIIDETLFIKHRAFSYEREWRLMKFGDYNDENGIYLDLKLPSCNNGITIEAIYLGKESENKYVELIRSASVKKFKLYKMIQNENYDLDAVEIITDE